MKLQSNRRIQRSDYDPQYQSLVDRLSVIINSSMESLFGALNGQVSIADNILCTVKTFSVTVNSDGIPTSNASFALSFTGQVKGITVINATNTTNSLVYPTNTPFISYTQSGTSVIINHVTGLQANNAYNITLICWG